MSEVNKAITLQQAKTLYDDLRERQENIPSAENIVMVQDQQPTLPANKVWLTQTPPSGVEVPTYEEFTGVIAPDYADLDFPVSAGEHCIHNGVLYTAKQDINSSEAWTAAHWEAGSVSSKLTEISNAIDGISTGQKDITGCMPIPMVANKYISLSGSTVPMSDGHPAYSSGETVYSCGYIACAEGDVFTVNGTGGGATRLWGFVDDEGNILSVADASITESGFTLVAPADSAWFITHTNDGSISYKGNMLELIGELMIYPYESINNFGQGSISGTDGHIIESTTRIYTNKYFPFEEGLVLTCDANIKWSLRYYRQSLDLYTADQNWRTAGGVVKTTEPQIVKYFRINIAYDDDSTITPSDAITIKLWKTKQVTDKTLSIEGKIADAKTVGDRLKELSSTPTPSSSMLGNATIRAAKTINFADGTPPVIDWYLVQTLDSKFYRTKDFVSKEYLFTTRNSGMAGYVSDWSCAILPNNDVLFVADAAGLSTSTYGRLKDENRINPIVFLASENYAQAHVIDFGSSLKPCGWLNNVGFCTLPNGDFVFAEYTRGTVKTANVWLVSGDVSDPSNWSVTWSVNIIDTMDSTTPGTKHCHEVMYDFFTGILYFGTGDSETGSNNYYSTDGGETWTLLYGEDKNRCRRLNFIFTEDYVYWASDSWQAEDHHFFIGQRDNNGIVDVENATEVSLTSGNGQACYGVVYLKEQNLIIMMDRIDDPVTNKLNWYCYDLTTGTVEKIGEIGSATGTLSYLGFRCRFMDFYPTGNAILTGFSPRTTSSNEDTNRNKLCGNQGGASGDGSTRINNLLLYVYKNGTDYSYRATTLWI